MSDSRSNTRVNVTWRGAVQISKEKIIGMKLVNFSGDGAQILCPIKLVEKQTYPTMIEIPDPLNAAVKIQVICEATVMYATLSGDEYRTGMKIFSIPEKHHKLIRPYLFVQ
jgi:hypothetical protein